MNYKIIIDGQKLLDFIEWLPELQPGEVFLCCLLARKKYSYGEILDSSQVLLSRFTATKSSLFHKIQQLECPIGSYWLSKECKEVPQDALALYITPNPRSLEKASKEAALKLVDLLTKKYNGFNPHQEAMSAIQASKSRTVFVDFDFDGVEIEEVKLSLDWVINRDAVTFVKTRGGFHLLVEPDKVEKAFKNTWHKSLQSIPGVDYERRATDRMLPVPGTSQGMFCPYILKY